MSKKKVCLILSITILLVLALVLSGCYTQEPEELASEKETETIIEDAAETEPIIESDIDEVTEDKTQPYEYNDFSAETYKQLSDDDVWEAENGENGAGPYTIYGLGDNVELEESYCDGNLGYTLYVKIGNNCEEKAFFDKAHFVIRTIFSCSDSSADNVLETIKQGKSYDLNTGYQTFHIYCDSPGHDGEQYYLRIFPKFW